MIQRQLTLRLNTAQEAQLDLWLFQLTGVWNWAIRTIELDAKDGISSTSKAFHTLLADHGKKLGIPSHTLQGMLDTAYTAWQRCSQKLAKKPRLKGQRNTLTSLPFPDPFQAPDGTHIHVPGIGHVRFHAQDIPAGRLTSGRIVKRASGWYLCLCIDAHPQAIPHAADGALGIDPGFHTLKHNVVAGSAWWPDSTNGLPTSARIATTNSRVGWWPSTKRLSGPKIMTRRSLAPLGRMCPVRRTLNFVVCSSTSALQAVGSSSQSPRASPPRPAQHVGASLARLAMQACQ